MADQFILVDTDILIDVSRGITQAVETLEELQEDHTLSISVVTQMELMVGCENKKEFKQLENFLKRFEIIQLSEGISTKAVDLFKEYRLSHGVLIADMLIASTAITHEIELISKNQKDYTFIEDLELRKYFVE
ncbi:VapC toxin family PIN domain ribonuclease [Aliifodinibius salipaludis]|uniref:VapC toxin family PIN domain ribonuclease n=1 Tax=Fodinibius salipaludis TaxID=2032627 RepID=A0A2A2G6M4_9BACT|nr:type II toxin-antitoxin system VapC family toxin [Aliifodinibius salipaludis]PAU92948.1 VapC toxin family PIN domain ribonuclease [Aliifodinibius salipaludis]